MRKGVLRLYSGYSTPNRCSKFFSSKSLMWIKIPTRHFSLTEAFPLLSVNSLALQDGRSTIENALF
jgi:hypothetical protein